MIILGFMAGAVIMIGYTLFVYHSGRIAGIKAALPIKGGKTMKRPKDRSNWLDKTKDAKATNKERRCSNCKFDKEDDDFPNCKMCLAGGSGFESRDEPPKEDTRKIDESNCWACMFTRGECDPCIAKLQTDCAGLKQGIKALHDKNVVLERQLKDFEELLREEEKLHQYHH